MSKVKRQVIKIDEELCNGCGNCATICPFEAIHVKEEK